MIARRALLGAAAALAATPAGGTTLRLPATPPLPVRPEDWVAAGLTREMLLRWGDRVSFDAPDWDPRSPTPEAVGGQFGWDGRLAGIAATPVAADGVARLVLAVAHPLVDPAFAWPGGRDRPPVAAAMQGASLVNLEKQGGRWVVVEGGFQSRRLNADTLCRWSGPWAQTGAVQGLLGLEGGCITPWGTLLLAEGDPTPWLLRLRDTDPRWREALRYGWVAELDPFDPQNLPTKRSALGRIGAAAVAAARSRDGRALVFLADGQPLGFLYRFVSSRPAGEPDALDSGTLQVARLEGATLHWIPLPSDAAREPAVAADRRRATRFDTPSGLFYDPREFRLLLACRAGVARPPEEVDALNPRSGAHPGHVLEFFGDPGAARMDGRIVFLAGEFREGGRYGADQPAGALPRNPATVAVDDRGRLWVGTDRGGRPGPVADAVFACELSGPGRAVMVPAYAAPRGAGIGGAMTTPGEDALIVVVRTPGAEHGASFDRPVTRWPAFDARMPPRTSVAVLARQGGGVVGG